MIPLLLTLLFGSALADEPLPPDIPEAYEYAVPGALSASPWWADFGDPELERLVRRALSDNGDLLSLDARLEQSQAVARQSASALMPSLAANFSASTAPRSVRCAQFAAQLGGDGGGDAVSFIECDDEGWYISGSGVLSASWGVDVWGASTQSWRASRFDAMASEGDRDAQRIAMATRVANAWLDLEATRAQLRIIEEQIEASERVLALVEMRYEVGDAAAPEVLQQRQQLAATRAQLPASRMQLRSLERQLAVLLGDTGGELPSGRGELPELPAAPATGAPADLVDARPDLRAAEARYEAAEARRKAAVRGALPTVGASASAGYQTAEFDGQDSFFETATVAGSVSVPLFNGGRSLAGVQAARAGEDAARRSYEQALRQAVYEVDDALQREQGQREVVALLEAQEGFARQAFEDSLERYEAGLSRYVDVLTALRSFQQSQASLLSGERELLRVRVDLHDALGGAWVASLSSSTDLSSSNEATP